MENNEKIRDCIMVISQAYIDLEEAKADCDAIVDSSLEELAGSTPIKKEDAANIKKMAKAIANSKREKLIAETDSLVEICWIFTDSEPF